MSHPNRSRRTRASNPRANPTPEMIRQARERLGLTEAEAAAVVYRREQSWRDWEAGDRWMGPGDWALFQVRTGLIPIETIMEEDWRGTPNQHD
jgi:DNA-binding transcriptional regulator YiaG